MTRAVQIALIVVLALFLLGTLPVWPYSTGWGYYPVGGVGFLLIIVLIVLAQGARDGRRLP